jgi:DNA polymerase-3 subunit alpha
MAALLTSVGDDKDRMALYLSECRRMGITVLPPDVNESVAQFSPIGSAIRFGLHAVRNVGGPVVESIVGTRKRKGAYASFSDFLNKGELAICNKRTIESLIKAGAFDSLGHSRQGLLEVHDQAVEMITAVKRREAEGQFDLFGSFDEDDDDTSSGITIDVKPGEWDTRTLLAFEREMLGLYVSSHPLSGAERLLRASSEQTIAQISDDEMPDGAQVTIAGMLVGVAKRVTKLGKMWASATLEDLAGAIEVLFFPNTYEIVADRLAEDLVVAIRGRVNRRDTGSLSVAVSDMRILDISEATSTGRPLTILTRDNQVTEVWVDRLNEILTRHRGKTEVRVQVGRHLLRLQAHPVEVTPALMSDLKAFVGSGNIA